VPSVSVVVPALNAARTLGDTLAALADQQLDEEFEVIVVDNGSDDDTSAVAEAAALPVRLFRQQRERAGSARNRGVAEARAEVVAFTDADCRPDPAWLAAGLRAMRDRDLVQGAVRPDPRAERRPFDRTVWAGREHGLYETANLFIRRDLFERIGGFEDWIEADVAVPFGEDVWLGWRARRAGARNAFCGEAVVYHAVFRRSWRAFVAERRRTYYFPALVARIPELREAFLYRRAFLSSRSATFDLALAGVVATLATRSPLALAALAPYAWIAADGAIGWRRFAPLVLAAELAADAVTLASLVRGSARWRTPVF
jgi:glycosyltransferase involved in cell wall biosynthesis